MNVTLVLAAHAAAHSGAVVTTGVSLAGLMLILSAVFGYFGRSFLAWVCGVVFGAAAGGTLVAAILLQVVSAGTSIVNKFT